MRLKSKSITPAEARAKAGLTQRRLAELVPTTQATVNRLEHEVRFPRQRALRAAYFAILGLVEVDGVVQEKPAEAATP